jgi:hypothetical protein
MLKTTLRVATFEQLPSLTVRGLRRARQVVWHLLDPWMCPPRAPGCRPRCCVAAGVGNIIAMRPDVAQRLTYIM